MTAAMDRVMTTQRTLGQWWYAEERRLIVPGWRN